MRKLLLVILAALVLAGTAYAGYGRKGNETQLWLTPSGPYRFEEKVFPSTNAPTQKHPYVELRCFFRGVLKQDQEYEWWPGGYGYGYPFVLGGWGPAPTENAVCSVTVYHEAKGADVVEAETMFEVSS